MTGQRTNRITASAAERPSGAPAYIREGETMVACSWEAFVDWLNAKEKRHGRYVTEIINEKKHLKWIEQIGSDEYYREKARTRQSTAQPIANYLNDFGRAA